MKTERKTDIYRNTNADWGKYQKKVRQIYSEPKIYVFINLYLHILRNHMTSIVQIGLFYVMIIWKKSFKYTPMSFCFTKLSGSILS